MGFVLCTLIGLFGCTIASKQLFDQPVYRQFSPVDCEVWYDDWSPCSATCGGGYQTREGRIEVQPSNGGRPCPPLFQQRGCNFDPCNFGFVEFDCSHLDNGFYAKPNQKCSNEYYACSEGKARKMYCGKGLFFDEIQQACDIYINVYACTGQPKPTTPPTKFQPSSTTPHPFMSCENLPDGRYRDPRSECSDLFFTCLKGVVMENRCPEGLYYDIAKDKCNRFSLVFACSGINPPPPTQPPYTTPKPPVPIDCSAVPDGDHPDPDNQCSQIYYSCNSGEGYLRVCPEPTFFDPELLVCDDFEKIPVCSGLPRPPLPPPTTPAPQPPEFPFDCSLLEDGVYPAGDCESYFWQCSGGVTTFQQCPGKLVFDVAFKECGNQLYIPKCGGLRTTPKPPVNFDTPQPKIVPFNCATLPDGNYAHPTEPCGPIYYSCSGGQAVEFKCPGNLAFDQEKNECRPAKKVPTCKHADDLKPRPQSTGFFQGDFPVQPPVFPPEIPPPVQPPPQTYGSFGDFQSYGGGFQPQPQLDAFQGFF